VPAAGRQPGTRIEDLEVAGQRPALPGLGPDAPMETSVSPAAHAAPL